MAYPKKIATCCYCGTRATLVLGGTEQHELKCSNCGAPLHDLKKIPKGRKGDRELVKTKVSHLPEPARKPKKGKRKKLFKSVFSEAFDLIEDIFD
jgi:hypothetical protein